MLHEYPGRLGGLAEIFRRRRVGVGVDSRGRLVLARPDTIEVDFAGGTARRRKILELVGKVDGRNNDLDLTEARSTGVLTVRLASELDDGDDRGGESRWRLDRLNDTVDRFRANEVGADVNHVVFGAHSSITQVLGGALTGASAPPSAATTVMTPENKAVLITTAQPAVAPRVLRDRLALEGHQRPRVLVIDTGLKTMSNGKENVPEHAFLQSPSRRQPRVHLHKSWQSDPAVDAVDDEDETDDDGSGSLDFEAGHGTFITGVVRQICPDAIVCPAGVLSSFGEGSLARVRSTIRRMNKSCGPFDVVVMSFGTFCTDDDPGLLATWLPRLLGRRGRCRRRRQPADESPVLPGRPVRGHRCRRTRRWRTSVVHQLRQVGRRLRSRPGRRQHVLQRRHRDPQRAIAAPIPGMGALEWDELRRTEGRRGDRPGDVPESGVSRRSLAPAFIARAPPLSRSRRCPQRLTDAVRASSCGGTRGRAGRTARTR